ncbi:MAG: 3-phosphoglycerate dehydrogenase, partial [bacterium]|nr:3-phosphoglycerate dehydrogenase [bacterium]
ELLEEIPEFEIDIKPGLEVNQLKAVIADYEAVILQGSVNLGREILEAADNLKIIVKAGIDVDDIDVAYAESRNIEVRYTPDATSITVAEYTIAQMLAISRFIGPAFKSMKEHRWDNRLFSKAGELFGKTAGIIGLGRIGKELAKRQAALGMKILYFDLVDAENGVKAKKASLKTLLKKSDFISIHLPPNDSTKHLIGAREFDMMKDTAVLIIAARGEVVEEASLLEALDQSKIKAVAIDVPENQFQDKLKLVDHEKVFPAPFLGAYTVEGRERAGADVITELKDFFNV